MVDDLVVITRTQFCKDVSDLQEAIAGNKAWGKFVNDHWDLAHHNIFSITEPPKEMPEELVKLVQGVEVARGCTYFGVASGNKEAPAHTSYIVAVPCPTSCKRPGCFCGFYLSLQTPCKHICYTPTRLGRPVFDNGNLHPR